MAQHEMHNRYALSALTSWAWSADDQIGRTTVIDGDTIEPHGQHVLLKGIDAAQSSLTCRDRYGHLLAHCTAGSRGTGAAMVEAGWALAFTRYSREYEPQEAAARKAKVGLWRWGFVAPWDWGRGDR